MTDYIASLAVVVGVGIPLLVAMTRHRGPEARVIQASFVAHILAALAVVWMTTNIYRGGDMLGYHFQGVALANLLRRDVVGVLPEVLRIIAHQDVRLPIEVVATGSTTGAMAGIVALLAVMVADSLYAECILTAMLAFAGKVLMFRALRPSFPKSSHAVVAASILLVPSVVYWSSGIAKEAFAIASMGPAFLGLRYMLDGRWGRGLAIALIGCLGVAAVKPYILFAIVGSGSIWIVAHRTAKIRGTAKVLVKPVYLVAGLAVAMGGFALLGDLFPRFAFDNLAEEAARLQGIGALVGGGSYYEMGDATQRTLAGQLAFAPLAVVTALFRPFVFEANNAQAGIAALETTALLYLLIRAMIRTGPTVIVAHVLRSPTLLFCLAFVLVLAVPVGLSTTNMGTLSRYRMPLVPCLALLLIASSRPSRFSPLVPTTRLSKPSPLAAAARRRNQTNGRAIGNSVPI